MTPTEAARVLGVRTDSPWPAIQTAYRNQIRHHHPDVVGQTGMDDARRVIEAYRVLKVDRASVPPPPPPPVVEPPAPLEAAMVRIDADTLAFAAPAEETWRWLLDAVHDVGAVTYLDRSIPIVEVLCRFVDEPATSLVITLQGRMDRTEAFCTAESIENRPGPPTEAVVDLLEDALRRRGQLPLP
ncbi:MAG: J domain-containing protein [Aquihabitans sp.]